VGISCPLCASLETGLFPSIAAGDNRFMERYCLYECDGCGIVFTHPILCDDDIQDLYGEDYYSFRSRTLENLPFWKYAAKVLLPLLRFLHGRKSTWTGSLEELLFLLARNIPQMVPLFFAGSHVLDVGCGAGDQMALWHRVAGLSAWGVDTSPLAAAEGAKRGLRIHTGELRDARFTEDFFDIAYANHVIEHVREPHAMLEELSRVLKPGGVLIIGVPNLDSSLLRFFKSRWFNLDVPRHLFLFSPASLTAVLRQHGFMAEKIYTITPAGGLLGSLGIVSPRCETRCRERLCFTLYVAWYILLTLFLLPSNLGLRGDWLYIVARKPRNGIDPP
jgi:SAM-dependent methyltransferase